MAVNAKKLPSGSWRAQLYIGKDASGKRQYKSFTAPTKREAERAAAEYERLHDEEKKTLPLCKAMKEYIAMKREVWSPSTLQSNTSLSKNAYSCIENKNIYDITKADVQQAVSEYTIGHSSKTVANMHGFLAGVLSFYGCDSVIGAAKLPQRNKRQIVVPTHEEVLALLHYYKEADPRMEKACLVAAFCGLRAGEVAALTKSRVNAKREEILVEASLVRLEDGTFAEKGPKSVSGYRQIPCTKELCTRLEKEAESQYVIGLSPKAISETFLRGVKKCGLRKGITFHTLRHYYCSNALLNGIPKIYLVELMGHKSSHMIDEVYAHTFPDEKKQFAKRLLAPMKAAMHHEKQHDA